MRGGCRILGERSSDHLFKIRPEFCERTCSALLFWKSFNPHWGQELANYLNADASSRKDALDSIMNNRNQISHGGTVGITVDRVRDYLGRCVQVLEFIED